MSLVQKFDNKLTDFFHWRKFSKIELQHLRNLENEGKQEKRPREEDGINLFVDLVKSFPTRLGLQKIGVDTAETVWTPHRAQRERADLSLGSKSGFQGDD